MKGGTALRSALAPVRSTLGHGGGGVTLVESRFRDDCSHSKPADTCSASGRLLVVVVVVVRSAWTQDRQQDKTRWKKCARPQVGCLTGPKLPRRLLPPDQWLFPHIPPAKATLLD